VFKGLKEYILSLILKYVEIISSKCEEMNYNQRILLHTETLQQLLSSNYPEAINILTSILNEENQNETGMFTNYFWMMIIEKFKIGRKCYC
jgi:hypothetical protein